MGSYKLKRLELPQNVITILEKQNIYTCKDALCLTVLELQFLLGLPTDEALGIISLISKKCVSAPQTVYKIYENEKLSSKETFFSTSLCDLDVLLHGGLLMGNVTELTGPSGVGKTQFCLMLSILATLPVNKGGLDGQVIFVDTESTFSAVRLKQIAQKKFPSVFQSENDIQKLLQCISVCAATSVFAFKEILPNIEHNIIKQNVKLVIVDSIASLFRKEYGASTIQSVMERNQILVEQASVLKDIAQIYNIVVFLTNQITSHYVESDSLVPECKPNEGSDEETCKDVISGLSEVCHMQKSKLRDGMADHIIPALGITWSHCVNTRLMAHFVDSKTRQLIIAKSPVAPNAAVYYTLNEVGISLTDQDVEYLKFFRPENQSILTKYSFLAK